MQVRTFLSTQTLSLESNRRLVVEVIHSFREKEKVRFTKRKAGRESKVERATEWIEYSEEVMPASVGVDYMIVWVPISEILSSGRNRGWAAEAASRCRVQN